MSDPPPDNSDQALGQCQCDQNMKGPQCPAAASAAYMAESASFASMVEQKLAALTVAGKRPAGPPFFEGTRGLKTESPLKGAFASPGQQAKNQPPSFVQPSAPPRDFAESASQVRHNTVTPETRRVQIIQSPSGPTGQSTKLTKASAFRPISPEDWGQLTKFRLSQSPEIAAPTPPNSGICVACKQEPADRETWTSVVKSHRAPGQPETTMKMEQMHRAEPGRQEKWAKVTQSRQSPGPPGQVSTTTGYYGLVREESPGPDPSIALRKPQLPPEPMLPTNASVSMPDSFLKKWQAETKKDFDQ